MKSITRILAATAFALPLAVMAQTTTAPKGVTPSDQPTSQTEKDAQGKTGQASKYGTQGTDASTTGTTGSNTGTTTDATTQKGMKHDTMKKSGRTEPGDAPTYPAPAKDGTPTK